MLRLHASVLALAHGLLRGRSGYASNSVMFNERVWILGRLDQQTDQEFEYQAERHTSARNAASGSPPRSSESWRCLRVICSLRRTQCYFHERCSTPRFRTGRAYGNVSDSFILIHASRFSWIPYRDFRVFFKLSTPPWYGLRASIISGKEPRIRLVVSTPVPILEGDAWSVYNDECSRYRQPVIQDIAAG